MGDCGWTRGGDKLTVEMYVHGMDSIRWTVREEREHVQWMMVFV